MARPHRKLHVWLEGFQLAKSLYQVASKFPKSEQYNLTAQLKRAAVSVPVNIAEGAARKTSKEFLQFLHISRGSLSEIDTLLTLSYELGMVTESELESLDPLAERVSALLQGLINKISREA